MTDKTVAIETVTADLVRKLAVQNPTLTAWELMRWFEIGGYDVWTVCAKRRCLSIDGSASPEDVIKHWMRMQATSDHTGGR